MRRLRSDRWKTVVPLEQHLENQPIPGGIVLAPGSLSRKVYLCAWTRTPSNGATHGRSITEPELSGAGIVLRADQRGYGPALNRWVDGNLLTRFTYAKTALRKTSLDR